MNIWRRPPAVFGITMGLVFTAMVAVEAINPAQAFDESGVDPFETAQTEFDIDRTEALRRALWRHRLVFPSGEPFRDAVISSPRSIDGRGNNIQHPEIGATATGLVRWSEPVYADAAGGMVGSDLPNPRTISNVVHAGHGTAPNPDGLSDFFWQWGQFLDHDIVLIGERVPAEPANIAAPAGDPMFDPAGSGTALIAFLRSDIVSGGATRQQRNSITSWIDASNVYGSAPTRASALRTNDGAGRLLVSPSNLLPFNTAGLANAGGNGPDLFLAGDVRANEQVGLTALHTLFVREHNRLARHIQITSDQNGGFTRESGEAIFQMARGVVSAYMQKITYEEFLPLLLGPDALEPYRGYDPNAKAGISNMFATAAYRFGHSAVGERIMRLDARGNEIAAGHLALRDAFFAPQRITDEGGIAPVLRGLAAQRARAVDPYIVDDLRNFLFGPPGSGGLDLAALNIQRGRDHGLPSYNDARASLGLTRALSFSDITSEETRQARLAQIYAHPDDVDLWVGGLAEDPVNEGQVGELYFVILKRQFEALRDGDRNWYERVLSGPALDYVKATTLAHIIRMNTEIGIELADDVFRVRPSADLISQPGG